MLWNGNDNCITSLDFSLMLDLILAKSYWPRGPVKCFTRNPGVLGSSHTGSSGFFCENILGQDTPEPQPSTDEIQESKNNVSCCRDMTEILLKTA